MPDWLLPLIFAPFVGSFAATLAIRLPDGRNIIWGRSSCPSCDHPLDARDLIPLFYWLLSRGICRYCGAKISIFYPLFEISAFLIAAWAAFIVTGWLLWASCILGWCLMTLAVIDARHMILPNILTLPLAALGLGVAGLIGVSTLIDASVGVIVGFVAFTTIGRLYARLRGRAGLGLGDAKMLAAAGAWVGWAGLPSIVGIAAMSGLVVAALSGHIREPHSLTSRIAFGPYLCAANWLVWLHGPVVIG